MSEQTQAPVPVATDWVIILAKQPLAGHAKTRLARDVGLEEAQRLAESFVLDTIDLVMAVPAVQVLIAFTPSAGQEWFRTHAPGTELFAQPDAGFGTRIRAATRETFRRGASRCVLIGTDTPQLLPSTLEEAFAALNGADVCLGPSVDGGYYLIGMHQDQEALFEDIPWSTELVHEVTLARAASAGLSVSGLGLELDVDEGPDLALLEPILRARPSVAARTRRALEERSERGH